MEEIKNTALSLLIYRTLTIVFLLLGITFISSYYLHSRVSYDRGITKGSLSPQEEPRYLTDDRTTIAVLRELAETSIRMPADEEDSAHTILGEKLPKPAEDDPDSRSQTVRYALEGDARLTKLLAGESIDAVWKLAPLISFEDREDLIVSAFAKTAEGQPGVFKVSVDSDDVGSDVSEAGDDPAEGRSALRGFLWYCQSMVFPKLERLSEARRYFAARELSKNTAAVLSYFEVENDAVDTTTRRRVSAVYLSEILFDRPMDNLTRANDVTAAMASLETLINPNGQDVKHVDATVGPPIYRRLTELAASIHTKDFETAEGKPWPPGLMEPERNLMSLLLVRGAFWRAYDACYGGDDDCQRRRDLFRSISTARNSAETNRNFARDIAHYLHEESRSSWPN